MDAPHVNNGPPLWLERLVEMATPERDRDAIVGDLREIYISNRQYVADALRSVPRVVAGRALAQSDVPSLFLQAALIFLFAGQWGMFGALPLLLLAEAYRPLQPMPVHRIVGEAAFISAAAFAVLEISSFQTLTAWHVGNSPDKTLALHLLLICPLIPPAVCGLSVLAMRLAALRPLRRDQQERTRDPRPLRTRKRLFWLSCTIPMIALHEQMVEAGLTGYRPMLVQIGYVGAGLLFFLGLVFSRSCVAPDAGRLDFAQG